MSIAPFQSFKAQVDLCLDMLGTVVDVHATADDMVGYTRHDNLVTGVSNIVLVCSTNDRWFKAQVQLIDAMLSRAVALALKKCRTGNERMFSGIMCNYIVERGLTKIYKLSAW